MVMCKHMVSMRQESEDGKYCLRCEIESGISKKVITKYYASLRCCIKLSKGRDGKNTVWFLT